MGVICAFVIPDAHAQASLRYLTSIELPRGVADINACPDLDSVIYEFKKAIGESEDSHLEFYVCGSASPDGRYEYNSRLSQERTDSGAEFLRKITGISDYRIHKVSLNEDWNRLYQMVQASDIIHKDKVLEIIAGSGDNDREAALRQLDGGEVWKELENLFFPRLRSILFAVMNHNDVAVSYVSKADTVYVRDTVYLQPQTYYISSADTIYIREHSKAEEQAVPARNYIYVPTTWRLALKTNLVADALLPASLGMEVQLSDRFSLDLAGGYSEVNVLFPDEHTKVYGMSPELRFYPKAAMRKGHFFGLHNNLLWYTLKGHDGLIYQNITNEHPAWSIGLTYGYLLGLGKNDRWGLEFYVGTGYGKYTQKVGEWSLDEDKWYRVETQDNRYFGLTRFGINLTYRFDLKKLNVYYDE